MRWRRSSRGSTIKLESDWQRRSPVRAGGVRDPAVPLALLSGVSSSLLSMAVDE